MVQSQTYSQPSAASRSSVFQVSCSPEPSQPTGRVPVALAIVASARWMIPDSSPGGALLYGLPASLLAMAIVVLAIALAAAAFGQLMEQPGLALILGIVAAVPVILASALFYTLMSAMIAVAVSSANRCYYCLVAHGAAVRALSGDPVLGELMAMNYRAARLSKRHRAMLDFSVKLTSESSKIEEDDREALRRAVRAAVRDRWAKKPVCTVFVAIV